MSCNCLETIRKKLVRNLEGVELDLTLSGQTFTTGTHVKVVRGKKRRVGLHIFHEYCPWCGQEYQPLHDPEQLKVVKSSEVTRL